MVVFTMRAGRKPYGICCRSEIDIAAGGGWYGRNEADLRSDSRGRLFPHGSIEIFTIRIRFRCSILTITFLYCVRDSGVSAFNNHGEYIAGAAGTIPQTSSGVV